MNTYLDSVDSGEEWGMIGMEESPQDREGKRENEVKKRDSKNIF